MESLWLMVLLVFSKVCDSARILVIQPATARSHSIAIEALFEELAARGHHLTVYTSYPHKHPIQNLHEVDLSSILPSAISAFGLQDIKKAMPNPFQTPIFLTDFEQDMCEKLLASDPFQKLLKSDEKFDLVITETFIADCHVPFAHKFKAPLITFVTSSALPWVSDRTGLPDNPSYIPNYLLDFSSDMNFYQRVYNTFVLMYAKLLHRYYTMPKTQSLVTKSFGDSAPPMEEMLKNTSLIFLNSHVSLALSRPFPPNVIEIGGIHIKGFSKTLPKDFQDILDQSPQGVILMSFGSLVRTSSLPQHIIRMFMKVFSTIPQTIIFKYEEDLPDAPPNVVIRKWLPQMEIIQHKNVKALFGHGGLASTTECVYFGKPFIGIPFFADQYLNVKTITRKGAGIMLDLEDLSEHKVASAIHEILNNPMYTENMRRLSLQFRDRPMTALQTAVFWTEYVIRHQGAPHLRPVSVNLPFYQYLLLDVIALPLLPLLPLLYLVYFLFFRAVEVSPNDFRNYETKKDS